MKGDSNYDDNTSFFVNEQATQRMTKILDSNYRKVNSKK